MKVVIKECLKRFELIRFIRIKYGCDLVCAQQKVNNIENDPIIIDVRDSDLAYLDCICKYEKTNEKESFEQNEKESFEQKVEEMYNESHVYSVTYTELVKCERTMTKQEIDKLLVNPCVKSINIIME